MTDITIFTSVCGGYDQLVPLPEQDIDVRWLCFVDDRTPAPAPWMTIQLLRSFDVAARAKAKSIKLRPPVASRYAIWIDGNITVLSPTFAREAIAYVQDGWALFAHPNRDCIYDEAEATLALCPQKYAGQPIREQVEHYRGLGYPEHAGLFAGGVIVRELSSRSMRVGAEWWNECNRWTLQDQLSLPVVLRRRKVLPGVFPFPFGQNPWVELRNHERDD